MSPLMQVWSFTSISGQYLGEKKLHLHAQLEEFIILTKQIVIVLLFIENLYLCNRNIANV